MRISILAISLGLAVMIIALAVLTGFQYNIREKVTGFSAHIQVDNFSANASFEQSPVDAQQPFLSHITNHEGIRHVQVFALKAGIIKTEDQMQGVILKGAGLDYDWSFFRKNLIHGSLPVFSDSGVSTQVLLSGFLANKLLLETGDEVRMYFITGDQAQPRGRKFTVSGIYETGLEEFDRSYVLGDLRQIQRLNNWEDDQVSGFEIFVTDYSRINEMGDWVYQEIGYDLNSATVIEKYPQVFDWLRLMDMNVIIILVLMVMVAGITMISTLLILILDRTAMIGILKSLGMNNKQVRQIFFIQSARIISSGLLWGNIAGLGLCLIQMYFKLIPLDQASYYMSFVPVRLEWYAILGVNLGTFIICLAILVIPGIVISRITPIRAIRFN